MGYYNGEGVPKDICLAIQLWVKAADQGHTSAQYNLALSFKDGEGVHKDFSKAIYWYLKAAEQNHVKSKNSLIKIIKNVSFSVINHQILLSLLLGFKNPVLASTSLIVSPPPF